jgi:hypothetical protein
MRICDAWRRYPLLAVKRSKSRARTLGLDAKVITAVQVSVGPMPAAAQNLRMPIALLSKAHSMPLRFSAAPS